MRILWLLLLPCFLLVAADTARLNGTYRATAYAQTGLTKSGEWTHRHIVAADPNVLPIGSRIKIRRAGKYSGEYVVADTGSKVLGRHLDIYMPSEDACKRFGTKAVRIKLIALGDGSRGSVQESDKAVKEDIAKDLQKKAVGSSATQEDWSKSKAAQTAAREAAAAPPVAHQGSDPPSRP